MNNDVREITIIFKMSAFIKMTVLKNISQNKTVRNNNKTITIKHTATVAIWNCNGVTNHQHDIT